MSQPPPLPPTVSLKDMMSSPSSEHRIDINDQVNSANPVEIQLVHRERAQSKSFTFNNARLQFTRNEYISPLNAAPESEDAGETFEHVMVLPTPRSLTKAMTSEYSMRPTPLMEHDRHTTMLSSLLKMGFDLVISEAALNQVNFESVESAVDAAFALQEEAAERRAEMIQQQTVEGYDDSTWNVDPNAFEMKENDEEDSSHQSITVIKDSPSFNPPALVVKINDDNQSTISLRSNPTSPRQWTCAVCTLINSFANKHCEMCGTKCPIPSGPPPLPLHSPRLKPVAYQRPTIIQPDNTSVPEESVSASPNCMICLEHVASSELVKARCSHTYCRECWRGYLNSKISDGAVVNVLCPDPRCKRKVEVAEIKSHVSADMFAKYEKFATNAKIGMDPNARWCCTPGCETVLTGSKSKPKMTCKKCKHSMCWSCNEPWHIGSCESAANRAMAAYRRSHDCKECPKCGVIIERFEGCSHVTCTRCKYEFCWLCSQKYTKHHFALWNITGCSGLQDGSLSWIGNDRFLCCNLSLGCGFCGLVKRFLFRIWVIFSFGLTFLICTIPVALFSLICAPCVYTCYKRHKRQQAEREERIRVEREARRERRRQRAIARGEVDENGRVLTAEERRQRLRERAAAQEATDIAEAIKRSQETEDTKHITISIASTSPVHTTQPAASQVKGVRTLADLSRENVVRVHDD